MTSAGLREGNIDSISGPLYIVTFSGNVDCIVSLIVVFFVCCIDHAVVIWNNVLWHKLSEMLRLRTSTSTSSYLQELFATEQDPD